VALEVLADLVVVLVAVSEVRAADLVVREVLEVREVLVFIIHRHLHHQGITIPSDIMIPVHQDVRAEDVLHCFLLLS
jgi:hypothetical protein